MTAAKDPGEVQQRRVGRRGAIGAFYAMVVLFILVAASQITWQVLSPGFASYPPTDCRSGLRALVRGVDAARAASEGAEVSPEEAIARFRGALAPAWDERDRIEYSCKREADPRLRAAFDSIEHLRYAEENAVRRNGRDLAPLRRKARAAVEGVLGEPGR